MIKPSDIIKEIDPHWDIHYYTNRDCGKGGFGFLLVRKEEFGMGVRRQIEGRTCRLTIRGHYRILGTIKPQKTLDCEVRVWVKPTSEDARDGYSYIGRYSAETKDYIYTDYAERLIGEMLNQMSILWRYEDDVNMQIHILDGLAHFYTYRNQKTDDWDRH